ncbi:hypothetical protein RI129_003138 [Pyrocoelia pectoralis]|uniref:DNA polymerase alpha subunit B n=1 Tax=Pyrocoelia pectoralis TaxID=417401 RepID=A0AAN7ZU42_9COLE
MANITLENDLINCFKLYGNINEEIVEKCEKMCNLYNLTAEDLGNEWGAYSACNLTSAVPTLAALEGMERKEFAKRSGEFSSKKQQFSQTPTSTKRLQSRLDECNSNSPSSNVYSTPKRSNVKRLRSPDINTLPKEDLNVSSGVLSSPSLQLENYDFSQRTNSGKIEVSYGIQTLLKNATFKRKVENSENCVEVKLVSNEEEEAISSDALHMFNVNNLKASYLSSKIEWIGKYLLRKFSLGETQTYVKTSGMVTIYGQICCDSSDKLDSTSTLLEGSQELTNGSTVELNFSKLSNYAIFPGQVVAVQGFNPHGNSFTVQKLYTDASVSTSTHSIIPTFTEPVQIVVAVGPFTVSNNLSYTPLQELIKYVTNNIPHVLILIGPFVDASQENISDITMMDIYDAFFETLIDCVMSPLEGLNIKVVLVPSAKDAHHHIVFPTPPYKVRKTYSNLQCIGDPSILNIEGITLGLTSTDVLLHLSKQESSYGNQGSDRISRLASHLLCQQSFYPIYPPNEDVCIDYELLEQHGTISFIPNILILPSSLRYFVKYINGCVVINPERVTKGYVGGTFCRIEVAPKTSTVSDNVVAQIIRI